MKIFLLPLIATLGIAFFTSCEKELDSLEGTYWKSDRRYLDDGSGWSQDELIFSSAYATYVCRTHYGAAEGLTGAYTFDSPTVTIETTNWDPFTGQTYLQKNIGTVKGKTITIEIQIGDIIWTLKLKKQ